MSEHINFYICRDCLHEQATFTSPCERCGSRRIEHVDFLRQQLGENWRELLDAEKMMVS